MAIILCPNCAGKISNLAKKCPHCGRVLEEYAMPMYNEPKPDERKCVPMHENKKEEIIKRSKKSERCILFGVIAALVFAILIMIVLLTCRRHSSSDDLSTAYVDATECSTTNTIDVSSQENELNIQSYIDVLGTDCATGTLNVDNAWLDGITGVSLCGYKGSITHGFSGNNSIIDIMEWSSNQNVSQDDFYTFISLLNKEFPDEYTKKSYANISQECYVWTDYDNLCYVVCWHENEHVMARWYLEENKIKAIAQNAASPTQPISEETTIPTTKPTEPKLTTGEIVSFADNQMKKEIGRAYCGYSIESSNSTTLVVFDICPDDSWQSYILGGSDWKSLTSAADEYTYELRKLFKDNGHSDWHAVVSILNDIDTSRYLYMSVDGTEYS